MPKITTLSLLAILAFTPIAEGATYKWVDSKGRVHFSDTPPAEENFEAIAQPRLPAPDKDAQQRLKNLLQSQEAARKSRLSTEEEQKKLAAQKATRTQDCAQVRERITRLESRPARRIGIKNEDGSFSRMTEEEKQTRLTKLKKQALETCDE